MKKLICEKDIQQLIQNGETRCGICKDTIITPSARDAAAAAGISFDCCTESAVVRESACETQRVTPELILTIVQKLIAQGRLSPDFCEKLLLDQMPYECEKSACGLKIVRGHSVHPQTPINGDSKIRCQEVITNQESSISSSILEIDHGIYRCDPEHDETDYVLEGSLSVSASGTRYTAHRGDCISIPKGVPAELGDGMTYCKLFRSVNTLS